jgi:hypothetical protein
MSSPIRATNGCPMLCVHAIEAARDCYDLYGSKCRVDGQTLQITLENLPLDEARA